MCICTRLTWANAVKPVSRIIANAAVDRMTFFFFMIFSSTNNYLSSQHIHAACEFECAAAPWRKRNSHRLIERQVTTNTVFRYHYHLPACCVGAANKGDPCTNASSKPKGFGAVTAFHKVYADPLRFGFVSCLSRDGYGRKSCNDDDNN